MIGLFFILLLILLILSVIFVGLIAKTGDFLD